MSIRRTLSLALAAAVAATPMAVAAPAQAVTVRPIDVVSIKYDPAGRDTRANWHINNEYVVVKNTGSKTLILSGYRIKDAANHTFVFPTGTKIAPGKQIMIRSGKGANTSGTLYWNQNNYVWNNTGDTLRMYSLKGALLER